jgi:hypothetical protein
MVNDDTWFVEANLCVCAFIISTKVKKSVVKSLILFLFNYLTSWSNI